MKYDFIIVGAGTSGGTLAGRLQEAGAKCLLLEVGKRYSAKTFPRNEALYSAKMFWNGGVDINNNATAVFLRAKCVGGGSVVNQALMDRFDDIALDDWKARSGVEYFSTAAMDPWYQRAEGGMILQEVAAEHRNKNAHIFQHGLEQQQLGYHPLRRAYRDCAIDRGNDCMACLGGCHRDSKQSTLVTWIPRGEKAGLEVVSGLQVTRIVHAGDGVTVHAERGGTQVKYEAAKGIVACNALGTSHLLLRSGFKKKLPAVGEQFSAHPQHMCYGIFDAPVDAHKGAFQAFGSEDAKFRQWRFKLENVFAPPGASAMIAPYYGRELLEYMKHYRYFGCIETCLRAETFGRFSLGKDERLMIDYTLNQADKDRSEQGVQLITDILKSQGAKKVVRTWMHYCLHLMGGCVAGVDGAKSVTNPDLQVHDHPNLYIADSSVFPSAPGINPALTIAALSHKLADTLIAARSQA